MRKAFNNIYVKNFPVEWTEVELREEFSKFGEILSLTLAKNDKGPYAFICYGILGNEDKEYGPRCAMNAVLEYKDKEIYVKEALKKEDREMEKTKEMLRYKNSKKRCNLYVKNFPPNTTRE
jgi:polyadenylate-binding protein